MPLLQFSFCESSSALAHQYRALSGTVFWYSSERKQYSFDLAGIGCRALRSFSKGIEPGHGWRPRLKKEEAQDQAE